MMHRLALAVTSSMLFAALIAMPAAADPPVELTDSVTFPDVNPCTGLIHQVTIDFEIRLHQHQNRVVVHIGRTGSTDSGYRMDRGVLNAQNNGNVAKQTFSDIWHRDDGSKFKVQGAFVVDLSNDAVRVDRFSLRCIQP